MFDNLSGKQGLLFGLITGMGLSAIISLAVFTPTLIKNSAGAKVLAEKYKPDQSPQISPAQATQPLLNLPKSDRPKVELFVMSQCPYGIQMEKAFKPAYDLLKNKAEISIKFVSYAMHGKGEVEENTRQYCAQQQDKDKFFAYVDCYANSGDTAGCMKKSGLNESEITSCVGKTNKQFGIMDKYNDQTTWLNGRFPQYPVHEDLNNKYGVQGSPTLVINGAQISAERSPEGIKAVICSAFNNPPEECAEALALTATQPGFGIDQAPTGGCGG